MRKLLSFLGLSSTRRSRRGRSKRRRGNSGLASLFRRRRR